MTGSADFFHTHSAPAVLKHGVLMRYAYYFAGRAGRATGGRVAFIDGYAGEGRYEDGTPGSPLLLASGATRAEMFGRDVKLALVESDTSRHGQLGRSLESASVGADQLLCGDIAALLDDLLDRYEDRAVFLFVDPFGLAFSRRLLEEVLRRSTPKRPIDVLYHFSSLSVARMGRAALKGGSGADHSAQQLDDALGAVDWRSRLARVSRTRTATQRAIDLADEFVRSVREATQVGSLTVPVRHRPHRVPRYLLVLFSRNDEARWEFANQASNAYVDWLEHLSTKEYEAAISSDEQRLFPEEKPSRVDIDRRLSVEAQAYLEPHLEQLLRYRPGLRPLDDIAGTFGEMLGMAREMHLRAALKKLHSRGQIDDDGTGEFWSRHLKWVGEAESE